MIGIATMSFRHISVLLLCFLCTLLSIEAEEVMETYCKPEQPCWPSDKEVSAFSESLSPTDANCFRLPTFVSATNQGTSFPNPWSKDPPFLTPYQLFTFRNQINEWKAYFVVMARNESDIVKALRFAAEHNLAIGVISTGHEFNDRNSGPHSIQVRTTCLRSVHFDLSSSNRFGHTDGVVRLGSGMTWGTSMYNLKGVHEHVAEKGRVVVSGHAGNVGIVGWSLGGGHGQLAPLHGLGVDQLLEIELVAADGSFIVTNANGTTMTPPHGGSSHYRSNADLFWAMCGGGGSTWGVITALTIKLHKPRNSCTKDCYTQWTISWNGNFNEDQGSLATTLLTTYFTWTANTSKYWSSYGSMYPLENGPYTFTISEALFVGKPEDGDDFNSFYDTFGKLFPGNRTYLKKQTFDTFWDKLKNQTPESLSGEYTPLLTTVFLNATVLRNEECARMFIRNWIPLCFTKWTPCVLSYLFMHTLSRDVSDSSVTSVSKGFREAHLHASATGLLSLNPMKPVKTLEQKQEFIRSTLAPELYKWSESSYFSESQYSMSASEWKHRYWGEKIYNKLLETKRIWDPTNIFGCRHCVGDEEGCQEISNSTMPPWRYNNKTDTFARCKAKPINVATVPRSSLTILYMVVMSFVLKKLLFGTEY